ncbi:RidA family protein [Candidatus Woesearchaeota archaeon]|nr:RidA family protein [Candidatus Woesearchaeota archaeon]
MKIETIGTSKAPKAIGPYSQAKSYGKFVFTSGQLGINQETGQMAPSIEEQTEQVINNLKAVLESAGSSIELVIKTTVFLSDMNDFAKMNMVYEKHFISKPARSTVQVARLPKDTKVEIDAVAVSEPPHR